MCCSVKHENLLANFIIWVNFVYVLSVIDCVPMYTNINFMLDISTLYISLVQIAQNLMYNIIEPQKSCVHKIGNQRTFDASIKNLVRQCVCNLNS